MSRKPQALRRVLFVAEDITLAQVARLLALAVRLPSDRYEVHFACGSFDPILFEGTRFRRWPLYTIERERALKAVAKGERIYDTAILERYVEDELRLLADVQPQVVVGDFRLSLSVSARVASIHVASLINAYWSPYTLREGFPVPDHPIVRLLGIARAERYFPQARPKVFAHFAAPLDALRRRHGLASFASLSHQLCFGDSVLYADVPELCPVAGAPPSHHFLGAVPWSPRVALSPGLMAGDPELPLVYVTLGSSGDAGALPVVLAGLDGLPLRGVLSTAGRAPPSSVPDNFRVAEYVPGDVLASLAAFVVTNGGSSTGYQALAAGAPVLGVPANLDQYLAMQAITQAGAGVTLRSGGLTPAQVRTAAIRLLHSPSVKAKAQALAGCFAARDCHQNFQNWLSELD